MNLEHQPDQDHELRKILSEWRLDSSLPPRFSELVWLRIENREKSVTSWHSARSWFERTFARPAVALAYCVLLVGAGVALGSWRGQEQSTQAQAQLEARYLRSISPY